MNRTDVKIRNSSWSVFTIRSERHLHDAVLARALGLVHRRVGLADQLVRSRFRPRHRHHADAGGHGRGAAEYGADAARESQGRGVGDGGVGLRHQHAELVPAQAPHDVRRAHLAAHRVSHEPQHRVARDVAVRVVHSLEVRSEEHTSELQSPCNLVCRLLLEKKKKKYYDVIWLISIADRGKTTLIHQSY